MIFTPEDAERFGLWFCEMCQDYIGGSHYHCGNCGETSSMMGHIDGDGWSCEKREVEWPAGWSFDWEAAERDHELAELKRLKAKYPDD